MLPEGLEPRILRAAEELTAAGLASVTVLGPEQEVKAQATRLGINVEGVNVVDRKVRPAVCRITFGG